MNPSAGNVGKKSSNLGFTLIELMIVIAILGALVMIALPSYQKTLEKGRRADAKAALLDVINKQEHYMLDRGVYTLDLTLLGYQFNPHISEEGHYSVAATACSPASARCFILTATPVSTSPQAKDTRCTSFILGSNGAKTATGTDLTNCW